MHRLVAGSLALYGDDLLGSLCRIADRVRPALERSAKLSLMRPAEGPCKSTPSR